MVGRRAGRCVFAVGVVAATLVGSGPSLAATQVSVDCGAGTNLQAAIDAAKPGTILAISGTCHGAFTVGKNLVLKGVSAAVLDGQRAGTTLTVTTGKVRVTRMAITGGLAAEGGGGIVNSGTLTLIRDAINNNQVDEGSGTGILNNGTMVLQRSTVNSNRTFDVGGGGVVNNGTMTIDHSTVDGNPGGVYNSAMLTMTYSTVSRNGSCPEPGGVSNSGTATIRFSTIALNGSCNSEGGGIYNGGTITITSSTIAHNRADEGGAGLDNHGTATIAATVIADNTSASGNDGPSDCDGNITSQGYNLIGSDIDQGAGSSNPCVVTGSSTDQIGGSTPIDAMLKPLANYGGHIEAVLPRPGSPAANVIPIGAAGDLCRSSGSTDQRGIQRPQAGACDIGSVERKPKE